MQIGLFSRLVCETTLLNSIWQGMRFVDMKETRRVCARDTVLKTVPLKLMKFEMHSDTRDLLPKLNI